MKAHGWVAALALLTACSGDTPPPSLVGTWALAEVNAQPLPTIASMDPATSTRRMVVAGTFRIDRRGDFEMATDVHELVGAAQSIPKVTPSTVRVRGKLRLHGDLVSAQATVGAVWQEQIHQQGPTAFVIAPSGFVLRFVKR